MGRAIFYKWRAKYDAMDASMISRMKELEAENQRLKKMYAEVQLKAEIIWKLWVVLFVFAQCSRIQVESQTCLSYLQGVRAKSED
jgi:hypothetical protein